MALEAGTCALLKKLGRNFIAFARRTETLLNKALFFRRASIRLAAYSDTFVLISIPKLNVSGNKSERATKVTFLSHLKGHRSHNQHQGT